jgi:hypothetical protein
MYTDFTVDDPIKFGLLFLLLIFVLGVAPSSDPVSDNSFLKWWLEEKGAVEEVDEESEVGTEKPGLLCLNMTCFKIAPIICCGLLVWLINGSD